MNNGLVLVDTSAWIEFYKSDAEDSPLAREVQQLITGDNIVTTEPVILELSIGARDKKSLKKLKETFDLYHLASITRKVWAEAVENGFGLRRKGVTVPNIDLLIGTAAIAYGLRLLHADKHFKQIAGILPLEEHQF